MKAKLRQVVKRCERTVVEVSSQCMIALQISEVTDLELGNSASSFLLYLLSYFVSYVLRPTRR